jgi:hypothetical protein
MMRPPFLSRSAIALAFVVAAAFIPVRAHALGDVTEPRNANVDARGARTIEVRAGAGELRIEGRTDISQVQVRGTAHASSRGRLADVKLIAERRGDAVYIKVDIPENNGGFFSRDWNDNLALDLVIEVPQSIALDVEDGSGDSKFVNVGPLRLVDGSGDIEIRGARGSVSVEDGSGDMTIENVEGSVRVTDGSGGITASNIGGDFIVDEDGSGSIDVNHVAGNFTVEEKGSGSISSSDVKGKIDIPERHRRRNGD